MLNLNTLILSLSVLIGRTRRLNTSILFNHFLFQPRLFIYRNTFPTVSPYKLITAIINNVLLAPFDIFTILSKIVSRLCNGSDELFSSGTCRFIIKSSLKCIVCDCQPNQCNYFATVGEVNETLKTDQTYQLLHKHCFSAFNFSFVRNLCISNEKNGIPRLFCSEKNDDLYNILMEYAKNRINIE